MHLYLGADFAKYLFGVCVQKCITQHRYLSSTYLLLVFFSSHIVFLLFLDVSSSGQGPCHSWHLGSSLFYLIDFYCYMSFENQRETLYCLSALVQQDLCEVHW